MIKHKRAIALSILTSALALGAPASEPPLPAPDPGARIDEYLTRLEAFGFSGNVLVARGGRILLHKGYGMANREKGIRMGPDTVISIGSITKQFTAAAILKLEMQGKLKVEDTLSKFFTDAPADKAAITLHQLLTHTAGLESNYGPSDYEAVSRDEIVGRILAAPLRSKPGEAHFYSNAGYSLLGAIVEVVSGRGYEAYLSEQLFKPAGMTSTGYQIPKWNPDTVARGYLDGKDWGTILEKPWAEDGPYWNLRANGGIHSTPSDMYKWHVALEGDEVLSKSARERYTTPYVAEGPRAMSHYAYGWAIFTTPRKTKLVTHNGGNGIFAADFRRYVDENAVIYVASNAEISAIGVSETLPLILFGASYRLPPATINLDATSLDRFAGTYRTAAGSTITATRIDGRLFLQGESHEALEVLNPPAPLQLASRAKDLVAKIADAGSKGDFAPLWDAFGRTLSQDEVNAQESELWKSRRERLGEFKGYVVVGTYRMRPGFGTLLRLDFARGSELLKFAWDEGDLVGIRTLEQFPGLSFLPISATEFAAFDLRDPAQVRLTFSESAGVRSLKVERGTNTLIATR